MYLPINFLNETRLAYVTDVGVVTSVFGLVGFQLILVTESFNAVLTGKSFAFMSSLVCFVMGYILKSLFTSITPKLELA